MAYILDISTAVPEHIISAEESVKFLSRAGDLSPATHKKIRFLSNRSRIMKRYSCIPDFNGETTELYTNHNYGQPIEKRMELYKQKLIPLASRAVDQLFAPNNVSLSAVTHLITVSCTGMMAPGFEFLIAEKYGLQHVEKTAVNFLGCYAGLKALKQANYIAQADTKACVLVVCAELCSLHYYPSQTNEDLIAYLLFGDGASAALVCGDDNPLAKNRTVFKINHTGTGTFPGTAQLMTWNIYANAFRMYLSTDVVDAIKKNIAATIQKFLPSDAEIDHWAIHPGGVRIVEAVQEEMDLSDKDVEDSLYVLQNYGNMSSGTVLFILHRLLSKIRSGKTPGSQNIFSCAFGPGLNIEMISFSTETSSTSNKPETIDTNHVQKSNLPGRTAR